MSETGARYRCFPPTSVRHRNLAMFKPTSISLPADVSRGTPQLLDAESPDGDLSGGTGPGSAPRAPYRAECITWRICGCRCAARKWIRYSQELSQPARSARIDGAFHFWETDGVFPTAHSTCQPPHPEKRGQVNHPPVIRRPPTSQWA